MTIIDAATGQPIAPEREACIVAADEFADAGIRPLLLAGTLATGKCRCASAGCRADGKHPLHPGWRGDDFDIEETVAGLARGHWLGVATGALLDDDRQLLVIDLDVPKVPRETSTEGRPMKPCTRCGEKPQRSPTQRWCNACHAEYARSNRRKHSELTDEQRKRANARSHANIAQRRGQLVPEPCERCGSEVKVEKHHEDYDRPLDVVWLCRVCHVRVTMEERGDPPTHAAMLDLAIKFAAPIAVTPSGGLHLWWLVQGRAPTATAHRPMLDLRGEGGLVVVPPSGEYRWVQRPDVIPPDAPPELEAWCAKGDPSRRGAAMSRTADGTRRRSCRRRLPNNPRHPALLSVLADMTEGQRNTTLFRASCMVAEAEREGVLDARVADSTWKRVRKVARWSGLDEWEVERTIDSARAHVDVDRPPPGCRCCQ